MLFNSCWSLCKWAALLVIVVAVTIGAYLYVHVDDEVRLFAERILSVRFPHAEVRVSSAKYLARTGFLLEDVTLREREGHSAGDLLTIDEVLIRCATGVATMLEGPPPVDEIVLRGVTMNVQRLESGRWNVATLIPHPMNEESPPVIRVEGGTINISSAKGGQPWQEQVELLRAKLECGEISARDGKPALPAKAIFEVEGRTAFAEHFTFTGEILAGMKGLTGNGELNNLSVTSKLLDSIQTVTGRRVNWPATLSATCGALKFSAEYAFDPTASHFAVDCHFQKGTVIDARLANSLTEIEGHLTASPTGYEITQLSGQYGRGRFVIALRRQGWNPQAPCALSARAERIEITPETWEILPDQLAQFGKDYQPTGQLHLDELSATYDGKQWHKAARAQFTQVSLLPRKFPYSVTNGEGVCTLSYDPATAGHHLTAELIALGSQRRPIRIVSQIGQLETSPRVHVTITADQLPIDRALLDALPNGAGAFIADLHPVGNFGLTWVGQHVGDNKKLQTNAHLELTGCTLRYEKFPYTLHDVAGEVEEVNGMWSFSEFVGRHGPATIRGGGTFDSTNPSRSITVKISGERVPLEDELKSALPPATQRIWEDIRPSGQIDFFAEVGHEAGGEKPVVELSVRPFADTVSIRPTFFSYPLSELSGDMIVGEGNLSIRRLSGKHAHGPTSFVADVACTILDDNRWSCELTDISVDRLRFDRDLLRALPNSLGTVLGDMRPDGQMRIDHGRLEIARRRDDDPFEMIWQGNLHMHQASIECGLVLQNLSGSVSLAGRTIGSQYRVAGEISLDNLRWNDFFASHLHGPLWFDQDEIHIGRQAALRRDIPQRPLEARAYGGTLQIDSHISLDTVPRYQFNAKWNDGNLARLLRETWPSLLERDQKIRGRVFADLQVQGTGRSMHMLSGTGQVSLREAHLYELPQMIRLLKVLRVRQPDGTAFTRADANFTVAGERLELDRIDFLGDAVSLYGSGAVSLDGSLDLTFNSTVGQNDMPVQALRSLLREASDQLMRINVEGTISQPVFIPEPLPGLNQMLQQIHAELDPAAARAAQEQKPSGARRLLPFWK